MPLDLAELAGRRAGDVAVEDSRRRMSWGELDERTVAWGHELAARGVAPGGHLAVVAGNRLEFLEAVIAAWRWGFVYTPLKTGWTEREIGEVLTEAGTSAVVTDRPAARAAATARGIPVLDLDDRGLDGRLREHAGTLPPADRCGWKLPFTSGTTGRPKGVVPAGAGSVPFAESFRAAAALAGLMRLPGDGTHLFVSRLFHGAPLTFGLGALAAGARLRVLPRWDDAAVLAELHGPDVTSTCLVPTMFRRLLLAAGRGPARPPALRTVLHGGEPCPVPLKRAVLAWLGPVLVEYYGFTEGGMTVADSGDWLARPGTVGRPMPGLALRIVDDTGRELPPRTEGTICFVAPARRFAYLGDPDRTEQAHVGDAFTVGDVGWVDEDGWLFVSGRRADVVVSAGVNVYPAEIESALSDVPGVADLCAVGGPDPDRGERVVLFVVPAPGADPGTLVAALTRVATERLAAYRRPAVVEVRAQLPRDATGKLLRAELRAELWSGASPFAAPAPSQAGGGPDDG